MFFLLLVLFSEIVSAGPNVVPLYLKPNDTECFFVYPDSNDEIRFYLEGKSLLGKHSVYATLKDEKGKLVKAVAFLFELEENTDNKEITALQCRKEKHTLCFRNSKKEFIKLAIISEQTGSTAFAEVLKNSKIKEAAAQLDEVKNKAERVWRLLERRKKKQKRQNWILTRLDQNGSFYNWAEVVALVGVVFWQVFDWKRMLNRRNRRRILV